MKFVPFILATTAAASLVAWFAPGEAGQPNGGVPVADPQPLDELAMVQDEDWITGDVVLQRAGDGHFYAEVTVDAASSLMLVDTGASVVALTGEDAEKMGIQWNPDDVQPVARGAGGLVYGVQVKVERMQVGEFDAQAVDAIVVPEGLGISLLGQSFLSQIPRVEIDGERMILGS